MFHAWLGCALWHRERFRDAHQTLLTALSITEEKEDPAVVGYASCWLTWVCSELGLLDEALAHAAKAQEIHRAGGIDDFIYFSSVAAMGYALWHRGEMAKTAEVGQVLLQFGREHGDYRAKDMGYCCLGWSALIGGDILDACRFFEKAGPGLGRPLVCRFPEAGPGLRPDGKREGPRGQAPDRRNRGLLR